MITPRDPAMMAIVVQGTLIMGEQQPKRWRAHKLADYPIIKHPKSWLLQPIP